MGDFGSVAWLCVDGQQYRFDVVGMRSIRVKWVKRILSL